MLERTFCHIPRLGVKTEAKLWAKGIDSWAEAKRVGENAFPPAARKLAPAMLAESEARLEARDFPWFAERLPPAEAWRLYPLLKDRAAFVDIETTGRFDDDHITTIALYDGERVKWYVWGRNLEEFRDDIVGYAMIVTYNGKCFDVPILERQLGMRLDMAHLDLRWPLHRAGIKGGLKGCEKHFGLDRGDLNGVDGLFAVHLWHAFETTADPKALDTLISYNIEDVLSLRVLAAEACNLLLAKTPFAEDAIPVPGIGANPVKPDRGVVETIRRRIYGFSG